MSKKIDEVLTVGCGPGMLIFGVAWRGDRFYEEITRATGASLGSVVENGSYETPVYTECHYQDERFFLSGASHHRHWSLSVEQLDDEALSFDAACRTKSPTTVATVYETFRSGIDVIASDSDETRSAVERPDNKLVIHPTIAPPAYPATLRWRYTVRVT